MSDYIELVKRLRNPTNAESWWQLRTEAADAIERLIEERDNIASDERALSANYEAQRADWKERAGRQAESVRVLREALAIIGRWEQLNPVQTGADLPWLRGLVDQALAATEPAK